MMPVCLLAAMNEPNGEGELYLSGAEHSVDVYSPDHDSE